MAYPKLKLTWRRVIKRAQGSCPPYLLQTGFLLLFNDAVGMCCCNLRWEKKMWRKNNYNLKISGEFMKKHQSALRSPSKKKKKAIKTSLEDKRKLQLTSCFACLFCFIFRKLKVKPWNYFVVVVFNFAPPVKVYFLKCLLCFTVFLPQKRQKRRYTSIMK